MRSIGRSEIAAAARIDDNLGQPRQAFSDWLRTAGRVITALPIALCLSSVSLGLGVLVFIGEWIAGPSRWLKAGVDWAANWFLNWVWPLEDGDDPDEDDDDDGWPDEDERRRPMANLLVFPRRPPDDAA
ncbi:hypothetical protein HY375_03980 [Candidatus Berkelbacteria bacterium]|nr:hypothetical protein [Candidatus Berkelbacteria bacterium]